MIFWSIASLLVSGFFFVNIKAPLMRAYIIINYVLVTNPSFAWALFGISHPKYIPGHDSYVTAMMYMSLYNIVLCGSFMLLMRSVPRSHAVKRLITGHRINYVQSVDRVVTVALLLALVGLAAKFSLHAMGALRMLDSGGGGPFLQAMKILAGFDLMALILLGELRLMKRVPSLLTRLALPGLLAVVIGFAVYSGSRAQSVTALIVGMLAYRDLVRRYWFVVWPGVAALIPTIFVLFPLLGYYRISGYSFAEARYQLDQAGLSPGKIAADVIVTRLNYQEAIARAVDYVQFNGPQGGAVYWNNIIGIVPRLLWPGKPEIANDSQQLGHQLGLVTMNDESTSIGLQVVGESFFEYGWMGLWVAVFQALIFTLIHKNFFRPGVPVTMTIYTFAALYILQRDGYFAVVPGLIWLAIGVAIFFVTFSLVLRQPPRRSRSPDALPYRSTY